jgi:arylsulfatase A-like enzyme
LERDLAELRTMKPRFIATIARSLVLAAIAGCFAFMPHWGLARAAEPAHARQPNIVFILSDDCGYADFGFQDVVAADIKGLTPALDRLASRGAVFTQAYVSGVVCSPSRAGILTGRYQERFGHDNNMRPKGGLPLCETLMPQHLAKLGYNTECLGKWHLGYLPQYHPNPRGFVHFFGFLQGQRSYLPLKNPNPNVVFQENDQPTPEQGYATDRIGEAACRSIKKLAVAGKPFIQYVAFNAAHAPLQPRPGDWEWVANLHARSKGRGNYIGLMKALDDNVAAIVSAIDAAGIANDTIIVFLNDNGGQTLTCADNGILHGHKGQVWEGGSRVPFVIVWPGKIQAGQRIAEPVISLDLLPTLLAAAGGQAPVNLDGISLLPRVTGQTNKLPNRPFFWRMGGSKGEIAVRHGNLKLVWERNKGGAPALFDLAADPSEKRDLSADRKADRDGLMAELKIWELQLVEPLWGPGSKGSDNQPSKEDGQEGE